MKLMHFNKDGTYRIENARIRTRMIEMPDGYHPTTNDSIWQDSKRRMAPIVMLTEDVLGPYGASMAEEDILHLLYDIELAERAFKSQSVSKIWQRQLAAAMNWIAKSLPILFIVAVAAYAVYGSLTGGG